MTGTARAGNAARQRALAGPALLLAVGLVACSPATPPSPEPPQAGPATGTVDTTSFVSVVDGDTIKTSAGTVRLIGIDTPERGQCGHGDASAAIGLLLAPGDPVVLELPAGQNDDDRYGRLIRYAATETGTDLGLTQLQAGNAVARYDSSDGYPAHPREEEYRSAQRATLDADGVVVTTACRDAAAPLVPDAGDAWWQQYSSCTRLKKNTTGHPTGPFSRDDPAQSAIYDWFAHRTGNDGDGDGDGLACE